MFKKILAVIFPDRCAGCRVSGTLLCKTCTKNLQPAVLPADSYISSIFSYKDPKVRNLIHLLKYKNTRHVADIFAPYLSSAILEFVGEEEFFIGSNPIALIPIPIFKKRQKKRGYNQAELLARATLKLLPRDKFFLATNVLQKTKETESQARVGKRSLRLQNLGDCFAVSEGALAQVSKDTTIFLIDDVVTTGATLALARQTLRKSGYAKIYAFTVAH